MEEKSNEKELLNLTRNFCLRKNNSLVNKAFYTLLTIKKGESENLEFKESLNLKDEIGEAISAFSNTKGGRILAGINDSGKLIGIDIGNKTIEELANYIKQNTDNHVYPAINVAIIGSKKLIIIDVKEADEKPVFFKGKSYKRVGKSNHKLSASEIRKLAKESGRKVQWDAQICEGASLNDIDWKFIKETFIPLYENFSEKKAAGSPKAILQPLGCIIDERPTNAGILLFGKEPQKFFINSYIALAKYKSKSVEAERLDYKEFSGNLFSQIGSCNKYIESSIAIMSRLIPGKIQRQDIPEYGLFSIRELITNAICHRNYENQHMKVIIKMFSDRIEFYNPGGLPKEITPLNITEKQFSRNPIIAKVLAKVKYIEELGEGWDKIMDEHQKHLLKPRLPIIKSDAHTTTVAIFSTKEKFSEERALKHLSDRQKQIIKFIEKNGRITTSSCADLLDVSADTALRELTMLKSLNLIKLKGIGRGVYYVIN